MSLLPVGLLVLVAGADQPTGLQAFVVPTGAMAPVIMGYHKEVTCPSCRYVLAVNASREAEPFPGLKPSRVSDCICPNCRQPIELLTASQKPTRPGEVADPGITSGDRVALVAEANPKEWVPERFAIVVFDHPPSREQGEAPKPPTPVRYVMRVVGLPGETIAIHAGNLYRLPAPARRARFDDLKDVPEGDRAARALTLWRPEHLHIDDQEAQGLWKKGAFAMLRKPPAVVLAQRHLVYNNLYQARDQPARWVHEPKSSWKTDGTTFRATPGEDAPMSWLRYRHLKREQPDKPSLITDFTDYNSSKQQHPAPTGKNWVGDLLLECTVEVGKAQGELVLELGKGTDRFQAAWDLASGTCTLWRKSLGDAGPVKLASKPTAVRQAGVYQLRLANLDERLTVWVEGQLPFGDGVEYAPATRAGPTKENDLEPARLGVRGAAVHVSQLRLYRDGYYTLWENQLPVDEEDPLLDPADPTTWKPLAELPVQTYYVQPGHLLVLGDNSARASDSRAWGLVPQRLLLGRVRQRYFPLHRLGRVD
jgi:signal peptidase I